MAVYKVRSKAESYGHDVGILLIDCRTPFIPGDVGNASSYGYPVLYRTVPDVTLERLIEKGDLSLTEKVIEEARMLEAFGVTAITSDCGYMMHFQEQVAAAVKIPVMLSSLLQLPFIASLLGPEQAVGIVCANRKRLTSELLAKAYPAARIPVHVAGLETCPNFRGPILDETDTLNSDLIEAEVVATAEALCGDHPEIGAILLECSNLPPYAHAVQARTGRPVFDFLTMIDFVRSAGRRKPFSGNY
ncbi:aspartate/glutamate racemase family protein [Mesorhizobium sp. LHD-90]|uniref:aspartate/glutamate racemase family protein n=1 Tax=Mesorhizobium sp. LHD-90 TaxID=3071414 RepID=UPI0027E0466B|nr:aspartate/glutamate racemase family protein [Mesorhizobium sp. LHD-90]MDQ6433914.1 aspartate/glutamate racemase family protein [Mesorhizobium sp. LHD-90]